MPDDLADKLDRILVVLERIERSLDRVAAPTMTLADVQRVVGCSRSKAFELIRNGSLVPVRHSKQTRVTTESVYQLLGLPTPRLR